MSNRIVQCIKFLNLDGSVRSYDVTFAYDNTDIPDSHTTISVLAQFLSDPNDLNELKTLACKRAKETANMYDNSVVISDLNGPVTF